MPADPIPLPSRSPEQEGVGLRQGQCHSPAHVPAHLTIFPHQLLSQVRCQPLLSCCCFIPSYAIHQVDQGGKVPPPFQTRLQILPLFLLLLAQQHLDWLLPSI
eukprot:2610933-Ditylum_brightwellii.AAC.1